MNYEDILNFLRTEKARFTETDFNLITEKISFAFNDNVSCKDLKLKGDAYFKSGDYENAILYYSKYLSKEENEMIFSNRAASYMQIGKHEAAIEDCEKAIELNSLFLRPYFRLAKIFAEQKNEEKKIEYLNKVLEIEPDNEEAKKLLESVPKDDSKKDLFNNVQEYMKNNPDMMKQAEEMAKKMGFFK